VQGDFEEWRIERLNVPHEVYRLLKNAGIDTMGQAIKAIGEEPETLERFAARIGVGRAKAEKIKKQIELLREEADEEQLRTMRTEEQKCSLAELASSDEATITPEEAAGALGCAASTLRTQARTNPAGLGFPVMQLGKTLKIPRGPFVEYMMHGPQGEARYQAERGYTASVSFGRYPATCGVGVETQGSSMEIMQLLTDGILEMFARQMGIKNVREMTKALCGMMMAKAEAMSGYAEMQSAWEKNKGENE